jgi:ribosomal protein S18 acetylase RimI-like enzyme
MRALPRFDIAEYVQLLTALRARGYRFETLDTIRQESSPSVAYIRHDADFLLEPQLEFAHLEASLGCRATYYFLLTGPYNLFAAPNCQILREIAAIGHTVGLHYDLTAYPQDENAAREQLEFEIRTLEGLCGTKVATISTHNPHQGGADPFRSLPAYTHPHDPREQRKLLYVSDSCRAWRNADLLSCFTASPPSRLMLLTHPELWLDGAWTDRQEYLREVLLPMALKPLQTYFGNVVSYIWRTHNGARAHDLREGIPRSHREFTLMWPTRAWATDNIALIEAKFREFPEVPWTCDQILMDLPGKWEHSLIVWQGDTIVGFSFNSLKETGLYIHALFVAPEFRRRSVGSMILETIRKRAADLGLLAIQLKVATSNNRALQFYLQCGLTITHLYEDDHMVQMEVRT